MKHPARKRAQHRRRLVLMVKFPHAGRVKTRLAHEIGPVRAAAFYRHASSAVLARVGAPRRWDTLLAVAPHGARGSRIWPAHFVRLAQGGGDLGARMQRVMDRLPPGPVVIIGTDVPGIRATHIGHAFRKLGGHDAVLGPAADGGYWLVGLKRCPRVVRAFGGVRWSGPYALADTERNLEGLKVARVAALADVDTAADLVSFAGAHGRRVLPISLMPWTNEMTGLAPSP